MTPEDKREIAKIVRLVINESNGANQSRSFLTADQVAEELQIDAQTVRAMCRSGELKAYKIGKFLRIERKDLDGYINSCNLAA